MPITTTPSGGPQGEFSTYTPISTTTLSSNSSSLTVTNLPTTYTDLVLIISARNSTYTSSSGELLFNGDSGSSYAYQELSGNGTATNGSHTSSATSLQCFRTDVSVNGMSIVHVLNYSNTTTFKTTLSRRATADATGSFTGLWKSTSPITSITFKPEGGTTFTSGSTFTIYGIKAAAPAPKATGGDLVYTDNTYWYHVFNNSGIFDVKTAMSVDYLVVAGGGSGGGDRGGGGGAGGYRTGNALSVTTKPYIIQVGGGGAGAVTAVGGKGTDSIFSTITSSGGGAGWVGTPTGANANGGSGGGGWGASAASDNNGGTGNAGGYTPVEGYAGGNGEDGDPRRGGGGGGSSAVGVAGASGGTGGAGTSSSISGTAVTRAGGGGGGALSSAGAGGSGGGGAGASTGSGVSGTTNSGSGGGGAGDSGAGRVGGSGGSGIVIVRYAV